MMPSIPIPVQNATPAQQERFQKILDWDMSREKMYCSNRLGYTSNDYLNSMELEYKKYIFLICEYHDRSLPANEKFDDLWHAHIINVRRYVDFCNHVFGRLLYHTPTISEEENRGLQAQYDSETLTLYRRHFGEINEFWSDPRRAGGACCTH